MSDHLDTLVDLLLALPDRDPLAETVALLLPSRRQLVERYAALNGAGVPGLLKHLLGWHGPLSVAEVRRALAA
jgi:hypothetical protein